MERMEWNRLLSEERERGNAGGRRSADLRSEFEKDYHRIIGSASFRRLQDKTQVRNYTTYTLSLKKKAC